MSAADPESRSARTDPAKAVGEEWRMDPALMVWIAVVAISGAGAVTIVYALISAEPPTLELSEKEADREPIPDNRP